MLLGGACGEGVGGDGDEGVGCVCGETVGSVIIKAGEESIFIIIYCFWGGTTYFAQKAMAKFLAASSEKNSGRTSTGNENGLATRAAFSSSVCFTLGFRSMGKMTRSRLTPSRIRRPGNRRRISLGMDICVGAEQKKKQQLLLQKKDVLFVDGFTIRSRQCLFPKETAIQFKFHKTLQTAHPRIRFPLFLARRQDIIQFGDMVDGITAQVEGANVGQPDW